MAANSGVQSETELLLVGLTSLEYVSLLYCYCVPLLTFQAAAATLQTWKKLSISDTEKTIVSSHVATEHGQHLML